MADGSEISVALRVAYLSHRIVALLTLGVLAGLTLPAVGQKDDAQHEKKALKVERGDEGKPASTNVGNSGYPRVTSTRG